MNEDFDNTFDSEETLELINRFELAFFAEDYRPSYFDTEEFDLIIDYYLYNLDTEKAMKAWKLAVDLYPDNESLEIKINKINFLNGKYRDILLYCDTHENISGDYLGIWAESLLQCEMVEESNAKFREYILQCEFDEILTIYTDVIILYINEGYHDIAERWIAEAESIFPDNPKIINEHAFFHDMKGEFDKAIELYNKSLDIDPYNASVWGLLGSEHYKIGNIEAAFEAFSFSLTIAPDENHFTILQRAHCLFGLERYDEAKIEYNRYLKINPHDSLGWTFYAECYENEENYDKAIELYSKALKFDNSNIDALIGLSNCYCEKGENIEYAIDCAHKVLELQEDNIDALMILCDHYLTIAIDSDDMENYEIALNYHLKALELKPNDTVINAKTANIYLQFSMFEDALPLYLKILEIDNSFDKIYLYLALAYYGIDDILNWKKYLAIAKQTYPNVEEIFYSIFPKAERI